MKIAVAGTRGIPDIQGGVETHCQELFPRIASKGFDIIIIRRKNYTHDHLTSYKGVVLYDIRDIRKKSLEAIVHTLCAIWAAKWKFNADIVHIHAIGPALLSPFARLLGMKVVFTHHGPDYDREKWGKTAKFVLRLGERMGCKFANEVIVISNPINDIIKRKYNRTDAHLIPNGVPAPVFINDCSYLREMGVEPRKYIFAMGRFVPEKNFHVLIETFAGLNRPDYKLVIAGDADIEDEYSKKLKLSAKNNGVILTGFIKGDKLCALLTHA
ncbi:MAG: glycosyltransferase family 4 protein, partial [Dysgonamonadaceae bacterium]|nr:glycosyltransferase family 4 protein [Dysgonamonadaceae bacterium]